MEDGTISKRQWSLRNSLDLYNVEGWGLGYFGINDKGHLTVHPDRDPGTSLDLYELTMDLHEQAIRLPLLLRFSDILRSRIETLTKAFSEATQETGYTGGYTIVYPIKVNQQRHIVEEIVELGKPHGVGLETGSKPELQAVLALSPDTNHLIVCNGYKDEEYMRLALMGQKLGHPVFIVLEMVQEVDVLLRVARELNVKPTAGVRIKLASTGAGRWAESAGENSKFGMNPAQLVRTLDKLREAGSLDVLKLVHFHLGSQIPDIRTIKVAMAEVARYYQELRQSGADITHVDVGGGLGVDYEGSRSKRHSSANYSLGEYASDIVYTLYETCEANDLPMPHIISESGRSLTAYHSMLLMNVIDVGTQQDGPEVKVDTEEDHPVLVAMWESLQDVSQRSLREVYHDAVFSKERARELYTSGVLNLRDMARADRLYIKTLEEVAEIANRQAHRDILSEVYRLLTDHYFCNFSLFQSLPDSWAIDHLFPIMPIHRLDEEPSRRGTLQDITCDSDGKIDTFIGGQRTKRSLDLHPLRAGEPYILGVFMTGAYQEILGDLHNLFGDTNAVHIRLQEGGYEVSDLVRGDTVTKVLEYVQFNASSLITNFRRKVARSKDLTRQEANSFIAGYIEGLEGYTYLESPLERDTQSEAAESIGAGNGSQNEQAAEPPEVAAAHPDPAS